MQSSGPNAPQGPQTLHRGLGVFGATMLGLGSIVGTGVFVSIGVAAGVAGPAVILAVALAALLAMCNAFSSAQLAADHAVSGGTYEYGYRYLTPTLGFIAGWMFLAAKSASAATAALGLAGYFLHLLGIENRIALVPVALAAVVLFTVIVVGGIRRSSAVNVVIVGVTLLALLAFVLFGLPTTIEGASETFTPFFTDDSPITSLLHATALMFVAYTGYGRIATLGEEVREPRRTIPKAIITTLVVSAVLYIAVALVAVGTLGAGALGEAARQEAAPLEIVSQQFRWPTVHWLVAIGAVTAMAGVLLNLILGLSRVLLAMGRRRDMPIIVSRLDSTGQTPQVAVIVVGVIIALLASIGSVRTTWSFSAFTVLIYYAITNAAALRLPREARLYPRLFAWGGLAGCAFLAWWVPWQIWAAGLALIGVGLLWFVIARRWARERVR